MMKIKILLNIHVNPNDMKATDLIIITTLQTLNSKIVS